MDPLFYTQYFEAIATRLFGGPGHFWQLIDMDRLTDLNDALRTKLTLPALVLRPFEEQLSTDGDNYHTVWSGTFTVLHKTTATNFEATRQARSLARTQAIQILAQLKKDARPNGLLHAQRIHLLPNHPGSDEPIVAGQATGWSFEFDWRLPQPLPAPTW